MLSLIFPHVRGGLETQNIKATICEHTLQVY